MNRAVHNSDFNISEIEKLNLHAIVEIIYVSKAVVNNPIIKNTTENILVSSLDEGKKLAEKISPFDNYTQIIERTAEFVINVEKFILKLGDGIIIPVPASHCFNANEQFKMISTLIKSRHED